jgi:hypothetical protein
MLSQAEFLSHKKAFKQLAHYAIIGDKYAKNKKHNLCCLGCHRRFAGSYN